MNNKANSTSFKKGHKLSYESLLKLSNSLKGKKAWNKGKILKKKPVEDRKGEMIVCRFCYKDVWVENNLKGRKKFCSKVCFYAGRVCTQTFKKGHKDLVPKSSRGHTEETKRKIGLSSIGIHRLDKAWNWISDRTKVKKSEHKHLDTEYKHWAKAVKDRDKWECRIKNEECAGRLEAHHILGWSSHPELRYEINNGISLCHAHHPRKRAEEKRLAPTFQELVSVSVSKH